MLPSTSSAAFLFRRCPIIAQRLVCPSTASMSVSFSHQLAKSRNSIVRYNGESRLFSTNNSTQASSVTAGTSATLPKSLTIEAGLAAQEAMRLFVEHGIGKLTLEAICADAQREPFINRWQRMIQVFLQTQCSIIQLLGYPATEYGITLYTTHLSQSLQLGPPDLQEKLRVVSRDTYRKVLEKAFGLPLLEEQKLKGEISVVDARNMMHQVAMRMQEPALLEKVARECGLSTPENGSSSTPSTTQGNEQLLAYKHTKIQQVMVHDVYLNGNPSLVEECGFGKGEEGYVRMQSAMAEHQSDPLISQYVGHAMKKLLESADIDMSAMMGGGGAVPRQNE